MVVTSIIENNSWIESTKMLGIKESGYAIILSQSEDNGVGFGKLQIQSVF
jgi:hypothetical protein